MTCRKPLRKIVLFISLIEELLDEDHDSYRYFQKIKGFTSRVRQLINSMHRYNSLDTKEITHKEINLKEIINNAKSRTDHSSISITYSNSEQFILKADAELLVNLFKELLTNSCKFKHPEREPEVTITTDVVLNNIFKFTENRYKYENFVRIRYADNGSGFNNNYSKQIFELFRKLHENEGVGIGLPYCKKIIDMHHGTITVHSTENTGTKFTILLPIEPVDSLISTLTC
jgi:sigma-B regulation protein RsbU (phosphoserine phosphatase)